MTKKPKETAADEARKEAFLRKVAEILRRIRKKPAK